MLIIRRADIEDAKELASIQILGWKATYRDIIDASYLNNLSLDEKTKKWESKLSLKNKD